MRKLRKFVLTTCVLVLFLTPVVSNAAQVEECNLPNSEAIFQTAGSLGSLGDLEKAINTSAHEENLNSILNKNFMDLSINEKGLTNIEDALAKMKPDAPSKAVETPSATLKDTPEAPVNPAPQAPVEEPVEPQAAESQNPVASPSGSYEKQVIDLVNQERSKNGLQPLKENPELSNVAEAKAIDMRDNNYFSHTSPVYGSPFDMMKQFGIKYTSAGENIAAGQRTPQEVMNGWMNSEGHRANILNSNFTEIGVGYVTDSNGKTYWVQHFIRP